MEVRVDDNRDLVSTRAGARVKRLTERSHAVNAVHRLLLRGPLITDSGFDQDLFSARVDEHAVHVHANAVFIVRWAIPCPEFARDDSKHRSAVETEFGVLQYLDPVIT